MSCSGHINPINMLFFWPRSTLHHEIWTFRQWINVLSHSQAANNHKFDEFLTFLESMFLYSFQKMFKSISTRCILCNKNAMNFMVILFIMIYVLFDDFWYLSFLLILSFCSFLLETFWAQEQMRNCRMILAWVWDHVGMILRWLFFWHYLNVFFFVVIVCVFFRARLWGLLNYF